MKKISTYTNCHHLQESSPLLGKVPFFILILLDVYLSKSSKRHLKGGLVISEEKRIYNSITMDPALLKERAAFLKRAKATPAVETTKRKTKPVEKDEKKAKKPKPSIEKTSTGILDYKMSQGSSNFKFSVLAKIVRFLKLRYQEDMNEPLLLEEILSETKQLDITSKMKHWLAMESLVNNPKVTVVMEDGVNRFCFKPKFDIRGKKGLVKLLKSYDLHGKGGIFKEDIEESLPDTDTILKGVSDYVIRVQRSDKREVLFYNDRYCRFTVDEDFQKLWRGVAVEGLDGAKIEEYLTKQGISSMDTTSIKKVSMVPRRKGGKKASRNFKRHNDHLQGVLQDYTGNPGENKTG